MFFKIRKLFTRNTDDEEKTNVKIFWLFGDDAELHDRIYGELGHFEKTYKEIKESLKSGEDFAVNIGVSRLNFHSLTDIVNKAFSFIEEPVEFNHKFEVLPLKKIAGRFKKYFRDLQESLSYQNRVNLTYVDKDAVRILERFEKLIDNEPYRERELTRFLSMICEKTFIGPATIVMDPFHRCNTNCRHCWVHTPQVTHHPEFLNRKLDFELFKEIVDDAAELKSDLIILQGDGEPLMYEHTIDMLSYIRSKGIEAMFFTNGSLLTEEKAKKIIDIGVREIYCSLPAASAETYERVCPMHKSGDGFFERIVDNLKNFIKLRKKLGKDMPRLVMTHVMHSENYKDIIPMARLGAEIGADATRYYLIRLDVMNMDLKLNKEQVESMCRDLDPALKILRKHGIHFIDNVKFQFEHYDDNSGAWCEDVFLEEGCSIGWFFCLIPALTDLSLCCHLRTVGWLNKIGFKDLWLSDTYERYRRQAKDMKYNKNVTFLNGTKLYDEHCTHCDNHQTLIYNTEELKKLDLYKYLRYRTVKNM